MKETIPSIARKRDARVLFDWIAYLPALIVLAAAAGGAMLLLQERQDADELRANVHEENRLRLESSLTHVESYFDAVYSTLLFISLDDDIMAMRSDSQRYIQRLFEHQWEQHHLTEVYVVERKFTGDRPPFMMFKPARMLPSTNEAHDLEREKDEFRTQFEQMQRFATNETLEAQLSRELFLAEPETNGVRSRGFVYSVPIRSNKELVGLVAGMIQVSAVTDVLRQGLNRQVAFLANEHGDLIMPDGADPSIESWFRRQFESRSPGDFFSHTDESFPVLAWRAQWSPARIVASQQWWVVFLHPESDYEPQTLLAGWFGHLAFAGSLLGVGIVLAFLLQSLRHRVQEQARHLQERRKLEREVQEASERVQRRIGENLQEDLCQRLTGLEAATNLLKKRLAAAQLPETQLAGEIADEIRDSLVLARNMAGELQPVTLLEHGFAAALEELAARTRHRAGIVCKVEDYGFPSELDTFLTTHLYRIAQEAIGNALRHARARSIVLTLAMSEGQPALMICDDGMGLPETAEDGPGMGLRLMRYHADLIGADFDIRRADVCGTVICACLRPSVRIDAAVDSNPNPRL
jgi:signal transduction histidine kinase